MLIERYELELFTPPCEPGAERFCARARLVTNISGVLPYLNTTLRNAIYYPDVPALTCKMAGHHIALRSDEILVSDAEDRTAAQQELDNLIKLINQTWERREQITPSYEVRRRPTPMEVFELLPQINCRECGEVTCFTFALKLVASQRMLEDCPPLFDPPYANHLKALREIIIGAPLIR